MSRLERTLRPAVGMALMLAVLVAVSELYAAGGGGARNALVTLMLIHMIMVTGLQIFTGLTGVLSFGHVAFAGIGGYTSAILASAAVVKAITIPNAPWGLADIQLAPVLALAVGVVVGTLVGAVTGVAIARLNGLSAAIVTLALLIVIREVLTNWGSMTGGAEAFYGFPAGATNGFVLPLLVAVVLVARLLRETRLGLRLQAAREDELAAEAMGVRPRRDRYLAWVLSAAVSSLGGGLLVFYLGAVNPGEFSFTLTFLLIAMLALGGMKSVTGGIVGTVLVTVGAELMRTIGTGPTWLGFTFPTMHGLPTFFLGAVVIGVMLLRPDGLLGDGEADHLLGRWIRWFRRPVLAAPKEAPAPGGIERCGALVVRSVGVQFVGLRALDDVTLDVGAGEIVGLIGPNGAGKTTLLNVVTGLVPPVSGTVALDGVTLAGLGPAEISDAGVARTFQNLRLFDGLSVRDNIAVSAIVAAGAGRGDAETLTTAALQRFDLLDVQHRRAGTLSYGHQRRVEMARAVAARPRLLLLDEPAAGMDDTETAWLVEAVRSVRETDGCSVVVIDHDLHLILNLCERIIVLNSGQVIATGSPAEIRSEPAVVEAYLGATGDALPPEVAAPRDV